jgi:hypothetical protein
MPTSGNLSPARSVIKLPKDPNPEPYDVSKIFGSDLPNGKFIGGKY